MTNHTQARETSGPTETVIGDIIIKSSPIHGTGVFARIDLPADQELIEYVGKRIDKKTSDKLCLEENAYIFHVNNKYDIDGSVDWNPARFFNHSCEPNCEAQQDEEDRIWILTKHPVKAGQELTYNYGYDVDDYLDFPCFCGSANCIGYMIAEDLFPKVKKFLARRKKAEAKLALAPSPSP